MSESNSRKEKALMRLQSYIGVVYGDYTILSKGHRRRGNNIQFHVECICGKEAWCTKQELESGKRNRCDACGKKKRFGIQIHGISINFFNGYKRGASSRNIEFNISYEYAAELFKSQNELCALSGLKLVIAGSKCSVERTASLDRIDSTKGYIESNVQWIHKDINQMKMNMEESRFIELCKIIANYK